MSESVKDTVGTTWGGTGITDVDLRFSGVRRKTIKTRQVSASLTPGFNVPYLDTFRLSILSALFVQRLQR